MTRTFKEVEAGETITSEYRKYKPYAEDGIEIPGHIWLKEIPEVTEEEIEKLLSGLYSDSENDPNFHKDAARKLIELYKHR